MSTPGRKQRPASETGGGHGLTGGGPSQLGVDGSMRARDVSRPTDGEIATADDTVRISRRSAPPPTPSGSAG